MTNYQFLQTYLELQSGIAFDELIDLGFATVCHSKVDSSSFWNNALVNTVLSDDQIHQVATKLTTLSRKPAFYFENRDDLKSLADKFARIGYEQDAEDSLMFYSGSEVSESDLGTVKEVQAEGDLHTFIDVFDHCYQKDDPKNPYGELGEYLKSATEAWKNHRASGRIAYFIAYKDSEPVAVSALTSYKGIGYISNVGSLRSVRGEGFGKQATLWCVSQSQKQGNTMHCLATEEGTNPNAFYKSIGFQTRFTAKLMIKKEL